MIYVRRVVGKSMTPVFRSGKLVLFVRWKAYKPGDVVMFRHNGAEKIKRIERIEEDKIFVVGDNPSLSTDSRHFGLIDKSLIIAKALTLRS